MEKNAVNFCIAMKIYFRVIVPVFAAVLTYTVLAVFLGPKGIYSKKFIERQRDALIRHVNLLNQTGYELDTRIRTLTYDPSTIAVYAHELGYIYDDEGIIKLVNFNSAFGKTLHPGTVLNLETPHYLSDYVCKTVALSVGILVLLFEMLAVKKNDYFKRLFRFR